MGSFSVLLNAKKRESSIEYCSVCGLGRKNLQAMLAGTSRALPS